MRVTARPSGNRRIVPLHFGIWSTVAPDYRSENGGIRRILDRIRGVHGTNGICDRGMSHGRRPL